MDIITFLIRVFCLIDDSLPERRLRRRGRRPTLSDAEVLTIEIVGEFLGIDTDVGLYRYFRAHFGAWFPGLRRIHRTTFTRQAANLWAVKRQLWQQVVALVPQDPLVGVVDSFPIPVCRFGRAPRCQRFKGVAAFGYDEVARQTFYGLRAHLRLGWPGVVTDLRLVPANVHDTTVAADLLQSTQGWVLGDRNYWDPDLRTALAAQGLHLLAPFKTKKHEPFRYPHWLTHMRYRIETLIGQFVERFHAKRVWARDRWHLTARWMRKLLSHSIAVLFCCQAGLPPLSLAKLIKD
jgi:hypothetical protein